MRAALALFSDLEIRYIPPNQQRQRGPMETNCLGIVERMIRKFGLPHTTLTLRTIVESSEANQCALISDIVDGVSEVILCHPRWARLGLAAFDKINLLEIRKVVKAANVRPLRVGIATLIAVELTKILGPSRPPKPPKPVKVKLPPKPSLALTRIPAIERAISLGKELLALRASIVCNKKFGREVRRRFPDVDHITVSRTIRVARLYAGRPEVWRAASWRTLIELASPKMAPSMRQALEARILAGETITAPHIRKTRGRFKGGSPRRSAGQPAPQMAA